MKLTLNFLKKGAAFGAALALLAGCDDGQNCSDDPLWSNVENPAEYGWDAGKLAELRDYLGTVNTDSFMLITKDKDNPQMPKILVDGYWNDCDSDDRIHKSRYGCGERYGRAEGPPRTDGRGRVELGRS